MGRFGDKKRVKQTQGSRASETASQSFEAGGVSGQVSPYLRSEPSVGRRPDWQADGRDEIGLRRPGVEDVNSAEEAQQHQEQGASHREVARR